MFWIIVLIGIAAVIGFNFYSSLSKDDYDLQHQSLSEKFAVIVNILNEAAFNGLGVVTVLDKREFNLYKEDENQIIKFQYSTGSLTLTWKYKYYQKEVVHTKNFINARNLSIFEQEKLARAMISEMREIVNKHKSDVLGIPSRQLFAEQQKDIREVLREQTAPQVAGLLRDTYKEVQTLPEMMHGMMLMNAAGNCSNKMKESYSSLMSELNRKFGNQNLRKEEYDSIIDDVVHSELSKYITNLPPKSSKKQRDENDYYGDLDD